MKMFHCQREREREKTNVLSNGKHINDERQVRKRVSIKNSEQKTVTEHNGRHERGRERVKGRENIVTKNLASDKVIVNIDKLVIAGVNWRRPTNIEFIVHLTLMVFAQFDFNTFGFTDLIGHSMFGFCPIFTPN